METKIGTETHKVNEGIKQKRLRTTSELKKALKRQEEYYQKVEEEQLRLLFQLEQHVALKRLIAEKVFGITEEDVAIQRRHSAVHFFYCASRRMNSQYVRFADFKTAEPR